MSLELDINNLTRPGFLYDTIDFKIRNRRGDSLDCLVLGAVAENFDAVWNSRVAGDVNVVVLRWWTVGRSRMGVDYTVLQSWNRVTQVFLNPEFPELDDALHGDFDDNGSQSD